MPEPFSARPFLGDSSRGVQTESSRPSKQLAFTVQEYRERVEKVQREMAAKHLDGLLLHSMPNICYMTGMQSLALDKYYLVVVPRSGDPVLVIAAEEGRTDNDLAAAENDGRLGFSVRG